MKFGPLGLHVLIRTKILNEYLSESKDAFYHPHYSRQPIVISAFARIRAINEWNIDLIRQKKGNILSKNEPLKTFDPLTYSLSPIFLYCLKNAKKPLDIIEMALKLRNRSYTKDYRKEINTVIDNYNSSDETNIQMYKTRISNSISNLQDFLFEQGTKDEYLEDGL